MSIKYILLWLEGPLQSWGFDSKFGRRDSMRFPTKSGIYGMFLSALGAKGPQIELLAELSKYKQTVISYIQKDKSINNSTYSNQLSPLLMDFQMVGSGYDEKDSWQRMLIPKKKDGGPAVGGGSKMTYRYYLQDAKFALIQEAEDQLANTLAEALQDPVYDVYLGRKNCVPTDIIFRGIFNSFNEANEMLSLLEDEKRIEKSFIVTEKNVEGEKVVLHDVPLQFGSVKKYRDRIITIIDND